MINKAIILGVRRANTLLPIQDIKQSIGRAGRSYTKNGEAIIIVPASDESYALKCFDEVTNPIYSEMDKLENVAFHILPWWVDKVFDEETYNNWYSKTLSYVQNNKISWQEVYNYLLENECIDENGITEFGNISIQTYFSPEILTLLRNKLREIYNEGNVKDKFAFSYALAFEKIKLGNIDLSLTGEYKRQLHSLGYIFQNSELLHGLVLYCLLENKKPIWLKHLIKEEKRDINRLLKAISLIAKYDNLPIQDVIEEYKICINSNVNSEIAQIMIEFDFNKRIYALELFDMNVFTKEDLEYKDEYVFKYGSENLKKELIKKGYLTNCIIQEIRNDKR